MAGYSIEDIPKITKKQLQKLLVIGTHLHQWHGHGIDGLKYVFKDQSFIQIDPLNPAGRYHDFFLFARIPDYKQGNLERILYPEGLVFENFFQMMCFIHRDHFSLFYHRRQQKNLHKYYQKQIEYINEHHPSFFTKGLNILRKNGAQTSTALKELGDAALGKSRWKEGIFKTNLFELLYHFGKTAIVGRDKNFNKLYDLIERKYSTEELHPKKYSDENLFKERLKLHKKSYPVVDSRITVTKTGKLKISKARDAKIQTKEHLSIMFKKSSNSGIPVLVHFIENNRVYIVPSKWKNIINNLNYDDEMRAIGPLDPLIQDRKRTEDVFNFEYRWEIYTPSKKRRWGYYVLPLLYKGKIVGRIEPTLKVKDNILRFVNFHSEPNTKWSKSMVDSLDRLLIRWKEMTNASEMDLTNVTPLI
ncbi:MAG: DNA glycosylase AlkZ-like family protein [Promethearchaeota archaeon]